MDLATEVSLRVDLSGTMRMCGLTPDPFQSRLLCSQSDRILLLCSRQLGKSTSVAFKALNTAYLVPDALVLLASKTERQSGELHQKVQRFHKRLGLVPTVRDMALTLELANGSRIIALCGEGDNFRGFSDPTMCIIDEAAIVSDSVMTALLPMTIVSGGSLIALSTPQGKRGWFYEKWISDDMSWERINGKAIDSPRINKERLEQQRKDMGERKFAAEFNNEFVESEGQLFSDETIEAIIDYSDCEGMLPALKGI
jgi:hypothetical protein